MAFLLDAETLKPGLIIFRRADVQHQRFYCRVKVPKADRYKVVSLKTSDREAARDAAFEYEIGMRALINKNVPVFNRLFSQVASEYVKTQEERAETGHISKVRAENVASAIRTLNLKFGSRQVHSVTQADWNEYPIWRRRQKRRRVEKDRTPPKGTNGKPLKYRKGVEPPASAPNPVTVEKDKNWKVSDWTIRAEMSVLRSIMAYAASKKYIAESDIPKGNLHSADERREEFTREEYRRLHSEGRRWKRAATTNASRWYREMVYNFVLIMCNTGMRPPEAKNLRWRDVQITTVDKDTKGKDQSKAESKKAEQERKANETKARSKKSDKKADEQEQEYRQIAVLTVRGKDKHRNLVASSNVVEFLERIRAMAKATKPDDYVFTNIKGGQAKTLYSGLITDLLEFAELLIGPLGSTRSTYCFRHTYATMRLSEGVDVYLLAEQMGTSVQMIEDHYGHINPVKNADRILLGSHTWEIDEDAKADEDEAAAGLPRRSSKGAKAGSDRVNKVEAAAQSANLSGFARGRSRKAGAANKPA
jgi:integrase